MSYSIFPFTFRCLKKIFRIIINLFMNHPNLRVQYKEKRSCENRETFIVMCKLIIKHLIKNKLRENI